MSQDTQPPYILVVDDDHHLCDVIVELLTDAGYAGQCAYDGEAAWISIQVRSPDLVLSDISMPRLDGVSLARRLSEVGSGIPVILMSAGQNHEAAARGAFVRKPFAMDILLACIARTLEETDTVRAPGSG